MDSAATPAPSRCHLLLFGLVLLSGGLLGLFAQRAAASGDVFYEIFVRSFQDSDGDGIGDLRGVIGRLDYLEDLGVTGLWLMPIHPSPSYHGYDVTDFRAIHPDYGTPADFAMLLEEAHARGMKVVLDLVVNHTSSDHPWFRAAAAGDPAFREYYVWVEQPLDWRGTGGGPAWHPTASGYYLGLFWSGMPDLNYRNPEVTAAMREIARFWLELGVDGFRIDAIQHVVEGPAGEIRNTEDNLAWVEDFGAFVRQVRTSAFLVGETWTSTPMIVRYHQEAGLDMSFNYPLWGALLQAVQSRSPGTLRFLLEQDERLYPPSARRGAFISNHDQIRPGTSLSPLRRDEKRLRLAAGLLLTLPGTPFLYYGEELGMPNGPGGRDEEKRTPMRWRDEPGAGFTTGEPWYPFSTVDPAITVAAQQADPGSLWAWYRELIVARKDNPALSEGRTSVLDVSSDRLLAVRREAAGQVLLVLANFGARDELLQPTDLGIDGARDLLTGVLLEGPVVVPATALRVIELR